MIRYLYFFIIVALLAIMDGFNFAIPHDSGFWSLGTGPNFFKFDAWHFSKMLMLLIIAIDKIEGNNLIKTGKHLFYCGLIALFGQLIIYNLLFKSLI